MFDVSINYLAVLVAGLSSMVIGSIVYAKPVLGKMWMESIGKTDEDLKKGAGMAMGIAFIAALIMAFVLAHIVGYVDATTIGGGIQVGLWVWLGFVATNMVMNTNFEGRKMTATWIFLLNSALTLATMGAIIAAWQ